MSLVVAMPACDEVVVDPRCKGSSWAVDRCQESRLRPFNPAKVSMQCLIARLGPQGFRRKLVSLSSGLVSTDGGVRGIVGVDSGGQSSGSE